MRKLRIEMIIVLWLVLFLSMPIIAKSYYHPSISQTFNLLENGDVEVTDIRYFSFSGSFSWAQLNLLLRGVDDIHFQGVWDADTGSPLRYEVEEQSNSKMLKWYYQADNQTLGFRIQYLLKNPIHRYQDVAEFYWKIIEEEHASIKKLEAILQIPQSSPDLFKLFVHTQAQPGEMNFSSDHRRVDFLIEDVPANTFVEARFLTSPQVFSRVNLEDFPRYETILDEEKEAASRELQGDKSSWQANRWLGIGLFLLFISIVIFYIILFFVFYFRYGREPKIDYERQYEQEPPRDIPPAFLGVIMNQKTLNRNDMGRAFTATLLDLARRGYMTVEEEKMKILFIKKEYLVFTFTEKMMNINSDTDLLPFENDVLALLKQISNGGRTVSTLEIEKWGKKISQQKSNFLLFIEDWGKSIKNWWESHYFYTYDERAEVKKQHYLIFSVVCFIGGIFLVIFSAIHWGFEGSSGLVVLSILLFPLIIIFALIARKSLGRWSKEGLLEYWKWTAFKRFISNYSLMKEAPPILLQIWDRYLIYAVALGVAEKLLKNLKIYVQETGSELSHPSWYQVPHGAVFTITTLDTLSRLESISRNMANMANLTRALQSSTSVGGGFSSGGGGGGGGGGSSAG
ncbi:MAG TPA: hypothetical protein DCY12_00440 [Candidatus Atribacteria bacterium]|uniref:DUF2207 family protein n=1 Tax=Atribacter sp. TaxID=2847780 RepID=UPI000E826A16|nr:hypothetical protein [Candidatus Atribacteria bacterium]HCU22355.1 hypothetical protein [Candidatus Atribacteria bacterium]